MGKKASFLSGLAAYLGGTPDTLTLRPSQEVHLSHERVRIPIEDSALRVQMGAQSLELYPDRAIGTRKESRPSDILIVDPARYFSGVGCFFRLMAGQKLRVDPRDPHLRFLVSASRDTTERRLEIGHYGDALVFREPSPDHETTVALANRAGKPDRLHARRVNALTRVADVFDRSAAALSPDAALDLLRQVNGLLKNEPGRPKDSRGHPGGVVELPTDRAVVIVGDLHARVDNLLTILSHSGLMEGLQRDEAVLLIIGDAVHSDDQDTLKDMDSSVLIMDLILKLKLRFPRNVFFLVGNHDSFSPDLTKGGVAQGLLWSKHLETVRGTEYRDEMAQFYLRSPLVARSKNFCACHAGPPQSRVSMDMLVDIQLFPRLAHELIWGRQKTPGYPAGYGAGDVRRLRKALALPSGASLIVGHYPRSDDASVWLDAGRIPGHHVLYSAREQEVGVFVELGGEMIPQLYTGEHLLPWLNDRCSTMRLGGP